MIRRSAFLVLTSLALLTLHRPVSAGTTYLAIGDSLAFGETDFMHNPSNGDRGYVSLFADTLTQFNGGVRPNVVNLAFDGETTGSFFTGNGEPIRAELIAHEHELQRRNGNAEHHASEYHRERGGIGQSSRLCHRLTRRRQPVRADCCRPELLPSDAPTAAGHGSGGRLAQVQ